LYNATTSIVFEGTVVSVAWWAHLGGFVTGAIVYRFFLKKKKNEVI